LRQKALPQRFLIATTASKVFPQPANIRPRISVDQRKLVVKNLIRIRNHPREKIRVHPRFSKTDPFLAVKPEG
jgi:hypothetical protein